MQISARHRAAQGDNRHLPAREPHQVSWKHLSAYLDEFEFRFNNRDNPYIFRDAMKLMLASENVEYKELVA